MRRLERDPDTLFSLTDDGRVTWRNAAVARLAAGDRALAPRVVPFDSDLLDAGHRERLRRRLSDWLSGFLRRRLPSLFDLSAADTGADDARRAVPVDRGARHLAPGPPGQPARGARASRAQNSDRSGTPPGRRNGLLSDALGAQGAAPAGDALGGSTTIPPVPFAPRANLPLVRAGPDRRLPQVLWDSYCQAVGYRGFARSGFEFRPTCRQPGAVGGPGPATWPARGHSSQTRCCSDTPISTWPICW